MELCQPEAIIISTTNLPSPTKTQKCCCYKGANMHVQKTTVSTMKSNNVINLITNSNTIISITVLVPSIKKSNSVLITKYEENQCQLCTKFKY